MSFTRRAALSGALAAGLSPLIARAAEPFAPGALLGDADILEQAYRAMHPGLMRYNTPGQLAAHFSALRRSLAGPCTQGEALLALARLTAAIRCGHTYPNPFNQKRAVREGLFGGHTRLPFRFAWIGGRMVVLKDYSGHAALKPGTVIESVNGVAGSAMLGRLMPLSRADGTNDAKRVRNLEVRGDGKWEAFDLYAPLLWPSLKDSAVLGVGGRRVEVSLQTADERAAQTGDLQHGTGPAWTLKRLAGGAALLTMPTWALYDSPWDWRGWLNGVMDQLAEEGTPALIIDLRGNEGGQDCGDLILARLIDRDLRPVADISMTRYRKAPAALDPYLDTWDPSFKDWGADAKGPDPKGFYRMTRFESDPAGDLIRPTGKRFRGRVIVLIDASNSSATFQFAQALKNNGLATLVGQTNGGNRRGINGGAFFFLRLPASGLEADLPLVGRFPLTPQPDAGIAPDVFVRPSAAAIAAGVDQELAAAVTLVG